MIDAILEEDRAGPLKQRHADRAVARRVEVPPGKRMHCLWLDFFQRHEGMDYIAEVHKDVPSRTL